MIYIDKKLFLESDCRRVSGILNRTQWLNTEQRLSTNGRSAFQLPF